MGASKHPHCILMEWSLRALLVIRDVFERGKETEECTHRDKFIEAHGHKSEACGYTVSYQGTLLETKLELY